MLNRKDEHNGDEHDNDDDIDDFVNGDGPMMLTLKPLIVVTVVTL